VTRGGPRAEQAKHTSSHVSPPIAYVDESGHIDVLFASVDALASYLEWPDQFDEPAEAFDAAGRHLVLALAPDGQLEVSIAPGKERERLEELLRAIVGDRPMRFGLLDSDVGVEVLLRAIWRGQSDKAPYPGD
jgi:hypothetical protein